MNNTLDAEKLAPQMLASFEDLVAFLESQSIPHRVVPEEQKVVIPTRAKDIESELAILWGHEHSMVQCVHPLPFKVSEERISEIESAIARINHALMLPGFGLDHKNSYVYYRLNIPLRDHGASVTELEELFKTCVTTSSNFYSLLSEVNTGEVDANEVIEFAALIYKTKADSIY
jgi:hypothetical protein